MLRRKLLFIIISITSMTLYYGWNAVQVKQPSIPFVDFDISMQRSHFEKEANAHWGPVLYPFFKQLFEKNFYNADAGSPYKIPKIIHQIWLGSPFPEKYKAFAESWKIFHPDWEYKLWTDADVDALGLYNQDLYDFAQNYGEKADIARYEILYRFGGLYVDTDYECLQSFDHLNRSYIFYTGLQPLDTGFFQLGIGLIAAVPGHPLLQLALEAIHVKTKKPEPIIARTGPIFFTDLFYSYATIHPEKVMAFPASYFYPQGYTQRGCRDKYDQKTEAYAIHHWEGSWLKQEAFVRQP